MSMPTANDGLWAEEYLQLIADCEARESRLNAWEREFVSSLRSQIERGRAPTPKQVEALDETWQRATAKG